VLSVAYVGRYRRCVKQHAGFFAVQVRTVLLQGACDRLWYPTMWRPARAKPGFAINRLVHCGGKNNWVCPIPR